ncbi:hypothetical protein L9F63_006619 [Diploptera punctata]|uniref:Transmembrane protein 192 n=1 Tax=Diploptera punctata TaxID=6984 RepID=A0AAD7ZA01_DIPPU|nr:hypothetical protein L9F63_006619 [Diploptera punctata]
MVSLSRDGDFNTSTGGGVFFSDTSVNDDDTQRLHQVVCGDPWRKFHPLETIFAVSSLLISSASVLLVAVVLAIAWPDELDKCGPFFIILYIHAAFWCFTLIVDNHIKNKHHHLRINGYLEFYRQVRDHSRIPFYVVSFWNAVLLILSTVYHQIYEDFKQQCMAMGFNKPVYPLCVVIGSETIILICVIGMYIRKVLEFNRSRPPPDVLREEWMISFIQDSYSGGEIGYRDPGDHIHDLLEKQADLIRYLVDRNSKLSEKIMMLSSRLNGERS